jgi:IS30 family transposase
MQEKHRGTLSSSEHQELWNRWRTDESIAQIARSLARHPTSVGRAVATCGGIPPAARTRSSRSLTLHDRELISRGLASGSSLRLIAAAIGRPPSTISREVARHGGPATYRAVDADQRAWDSARRPKQCRLAGDGRLRRLVARKLMQNWAPQQIAGWLKVEHPDDPSMHISHETIYRTLFIQARGALKRELTAHLRSRRRIRRARASTPRGQGRGQIVDAISISERPPEVEDRAVPGHWEGDLLSGANNSHIATLVERASRFVMLVKVTGKSTDIVVAALARRVRRLPAELKRSMTWDRGTEMAKHKQFTIATDVKVYFCDPQSPWQRGSNENTNGLLRQYFPDGTDVSTFSQVQLNRIARQLNQRPRETLGFRTPAAKLAQFVAMTG